jgi:hypothetical protein
MFDHGSIAGHFGFMGLVDYFRLPKRAFYWYRRELTGIAPPSWPEAGTAVALTLEASKTTIGSDGTDDCQLIVSVVDASGKRLSNSPPVTLTIDSGPGEFPTGAQIPFDIRTPISIRDGQAAIEFRSYYAGASVIRATSPGLTDAVLSIVTIGDVAFSPALHPRGPIRLAAPMTSVAVVDKAITQSRNRPTKASSELATARANAANDGDQGTAWLASRNQIGEWWQVDLEHFSTISFVKIAFADSVEYGYKIETSQDGDTWSAPACTRTEGGPGAYNNLVTGGVVARYVRITLTAIPANARVGIREVEVVGT